MGRKTLLVCGVIASVLYLIADLLGAMRWEGYSYTSQTISELSAIGAPSRALVTPLFFTYGLLMIAFGAGVRSSAGRTRAFRVVGALLIGFGVICLAGPFTPMHLRGAELTRTDAMHITFAILDVLFILLTIGFGAAGGAKRFRFFSMGTLVTVLVFGTLAGMQGPEIAANQPTPWVGVKERISAYAFLLWTVVLAIVVLHRQGIEGGNIRRDSRAS